MSLRRRLVSNGIASAGSIGWTALAQLLSVPILTHFWGVEKYGGWLMIVTIPTYFALSDFGFTAAATTEMTMAFARGEREKLIKILHSVWVLMLVVSIAILCFSAPLLLFECNVSVACTGWFERNSQVLFVFSLYSCAVILSRVVLSAFRSTGNYALGTIVYDAIQFVEVGATLILAFWGYGYVECACAYFITRVVNILLSYIVLRRTTSWVHLGCEFATFQEVKRLFSPALSAFAIPSALSLNLQGMIVIAGYAIGPAAVALLAPVRTASRITIQIIGIINRACMPEFSSALAKNDVFSIQKILLLNLKIVSFALLPGAVFFSFLGSDLVAIWSVGKIAADSKFVGLIAVSMFLHGVWFFGSNLLVAVNKHEKFGRKLLPISVIAVGITLPLALLYAEIGLAIGVIVSEALVVILIYPELKNNFHRYLRA